MMPSHIPVTRVVHARLTAEDDTKLTQFCVRSCRSRSDVLRSLVRGLDLERAEDYRPSRIPSRPSLEVDKRP
jgi:hypothetical protein